ncbi:transposase [Lentzea aerocolonigenes]|uniref:transposase n=1 Tax=Lentzea aerocolonigenes TaxID=68170 RepID=UPI001F3DC9D7|nr:transposase [Lentzea aerocolonigenes]
MWRTGPSGCVRFVVVPAERFLGTVRRDLTDRILFINEHHRKAVLNRYVSHYSHRRPHQAPPHSTAT